MPYNPGVQPIGGQLIGQGLEQGLAGLAEGIVQRAKKRQEKENWEKSKAFLKPLVAKLDPSIDLDKDVPKEAIPTAIQLASQFKQEQEEAPLRQLRIDNEKLRQRISQNELDTAAAHAAALREAAPALQAGDARTAFATYTAKGGRDPRTLAELGGLAQQQEKAAGTPPPLVFASEADLAAKYPAERYDYKMTPDPRTGRVRVDNLSPRAAPQANLPPGYEPDPAQPGAIRPIKGSEGDLKRQEAERTSGNRLQSELTRADVILTAINQVLPKVDAFTAGFAGSALNKIAGTEAKDVAEVIDTIKANIGFEQLQRMREASPTGGALGQVAVQELKYLQAALGNLSTSQSPARLKKTLGEVQRRYQRWQQAARGQNPDDTAETAAELAAAGITADDVAAKWLNPK